LPLPRGASRSDDLTRYSASELENLVLDSHRIERRWLHLRNKPPSRLSLGPGRIGDAIIYVQLFLDRWLIVAFAESLLAMWDIDSCKLCAEKEVSGGLCLSSMASLNANEDAIIVAIAGYALSLCISESHQFLAHSEPLCSSFISIPKK
jgi:hypothetical protein